MSDSRTRVLKSFTVKAVLEPTKLRVRLQGVEEAIEKEEVRVEAEMGNASRANGQTVIKNSSGGKGRVDVHPRLEEKGSLLRKT